MSKVRAHFFRDNNTDYVELKIVGDPNTFMRKVRPSDPDEWPNEWASYQGGQEVVDVGGTALTEVPGITRDVAIALRLKGVRNVEELAALDDAAVKAVGMQGLAWRRTAKLLLQEQELNELKSAREERRGPGRPRSQPEQVQA